jgi:hypothetical protein
MTCAIPAPKLHDVIRQIEATSATDAIVASYAAQDARRFLPV